MFYAVVVCQLSLRLEFLITCIALEFLSVEKIEFHYRCFVVVVGYKLLSLQKIDLTKIQLENNQATTYTTVIKEVSHATSIIYSLNTSVGYKYIMMSEFI